MEKKEAFIWGFLTIPSLIFVVAIIIGVLYLLVAVSSWVIQVIQWIYVNMP
ncbi:hypothetical protein [Bacillus thuringiensis]|uniref:hypothetical protein n=1 Tax=Bacillus thuringiensis TaxID=1428 RepID=UPI0020D280F5|nr:hypothetical protein [Bacillus thuringiensis]